MPPAVAYFTVIDSCSAFFSVPLDQNSQHVFVSFWENQQYNWTVMPKRFTEAIPTFHKSSTTTSSTLNFPVILYVDDLLLYPKDEGSSKTVSSYYFLSERT